MKPLITGKSYAIRKDLGNSMEVRSLAIDLEKTEMMFRCGKGEKEGERRKSLFYPLASPTSW